MTTIPDEITIKSSVLDDMREVLRAVEKFLVCQDMAKCQLNYSQARYSPLTQSVRHSLSNLKEIYAEILLQQQFGEEEVVVDDAVVLHPNPLGQKSPFAAMPTSVPPEYLAELEESAEDA